MAKISDSVKVIVSNNLVYSMAISSGLCNYTKIAEDIRDKVEAMTGKNVKFNTIVKVLANMKAEKPEYADDLKILKKSSLTIEYEYSILYFDDIKKVPENAILIMKEGNIYICIASIGNIQSKIALIKLILPKESSFTPGLTLLITDYLMTYGIKFTNIYRLDTEIWIIIDNSNAGKALYHLSNLLHEN
ncbi:hypothetical protein [Ferroplasma sp.]|uniref:hypothetical protein n=1 Tax=Ferroplasma sp. TaxID=2591003 RepID=UPI00307F4AD7